MFNPGKTLALISGCLSSPRATWQSYLEENPGWQRTALELTVPMIVLAVLVGWILSLVFGTYLYYGYGRGAIAALIVGLAGAAISIVVVSFLISFLAGALGGQARFDRAFAGASLAMVPAWVGLAVSPIPFLGWLLQLVGSITALVFLYKVIPLAVSVPENKRVIHFVLLIVLAIVIQLVLGLMLGAGTSLPG
ncbi:MAG: hypothetical protein HND55_02405 [Pseudomonadota bacterium]|nr:MAG: hypothetical protein HND55_02405 [Pseudomonadota bacterium]